MKTLRVIETNSDTLGQHDNKVLSLQHLVEGLRGYCLLHNLRYIHAVTEDDTHHEVFRVCGAWVWYVHRLGKFLHVGSVDFVERDEEFLENEVCSQLKELGLPDSFGMEEDDD